MRDTTASVATTAQCSRRLGYSGSSSRATVHHLELRQSERSSVCQGLFRHHQSHQLEVVRRGKLQVHDSKHQSSHNRMFSAHGTCMLYRCHSGPIHGIKPL